jgi:CRP-like cAMP-binding protein/predicted MFS family arabinose efflux permease
MLAAALGHASNTRLAVSRPSLRLLLLSYFAYSLARKASRVVILIHAFDLGGVQAAAAVAVAMLVPAALVAPFGSALGDRMSPDRALGLGYALQGVALAATGIVVLTDGTLSAVAVGAALANIAFTLTRPVHQATLPDVAEHPDELALGNAASVWVDGLASMFGPLLAGIVLTVADAGVELLLLATVCFVAALMSFRLVLKRIVHAPEAAPFRTVLLDGMRELVHDRDGARLTALMALQYMVVGLLDVLLLVLVVDVLGAPSASTSLLAAAIGLGSLLGGTASVLLSGRPRLGPAILLGALVTGVPVMALGIVPGLGVAGALLVGYGVGKSLITVAGQTLLQRTVREDVSARVFGVQEGLIQAATAAGAALGPGLVLALGTRGALVATGVLLPLAALLSPGTLRRLDVRAVVPGPVFTLLNGVPFLSVLSMRTLERLARGAGPASAAAGEVVFRQGDLGDRYFVIDQGSAQVVAGGKVARVLGPGDGFGEIALLGGMPRTATVTAVDALVLVCLGRDEFLAALSEAPSALEGANLEVRARLQADRRRREDGEP